jgi:Leucine-rich repeat (LRR) protein
VEEIAESEKEISLKSENHLMRINIQFPSKRLLILIGLVLLCVVPLAAQDDAGYQEALRRIEEARVSGATELNLAWTSLRALPPEISQLKNLQVLIVYNNYLTTLPPEIGQLKNLRKLDLLFNQLEILPPEIGQLENLEELEIEGNRLTTLPPEIGQLHSLEILNLSKNLLTTLPPEIGQLENLREFYILYNRLTTLPPEIGQLHSLYILSLHVNDLTSLPTEIGDLSNLQKFSVAFNKLTSLPPEFNQLTNLREFYVDNNPFSPPLEVQKQDIPAILAYIQDYPNLRARQTIAAIAAGIGGITLLILAFRTRQRRAWGEKKKRL